MDWHFNAFVAAMSAVTPIPAEQFERAQRVFRPLELARGEHFVRAGEPADPVGFLVRGLLRSYYLTPSGVERTKAFVEHRRLVCPYAASLRNEMSDLYIQALVPSTLLVTDRRRFVELTGGHPSWRELIARLTERHYLEEERAHRRFLLDDASARYSAFLREHGQLARQISGRHTASYLGITPEALSRIRSDRRQHGAV